MPLVKISETLTRSFYITISLLLLIPLFPEYISPVLSIAAAIVAWRSTIAEGRRFRFGSFAPLLGAYAAFTLLGVTYAEDRFSALAIALMWIVMSTVYLAVINTITSPSRMRIFLHGIMAVVGLMGLIGCLQYVINQWVGPYIPLQLWNPLDEWVYSTFSPIPIRLHSAGIRIGSTFSNPNIFAEAMVMLLPFGVFSFSEAKLTRSRVCCAVCMVLGILGTLFTFSRGSYFALFAMILVCILVNLNRILHFRKTAILLLGGIMVALACIILIPNAFIERMETLDIDDQSVRERLQIWFSGLHMFWPQSPEQIPEVLLRLLFGAGAGTGNSGLLLAEHGVNAPHMHNLFLQLLVEGGLVSCGLIVALLGKLTVTQLKLRKKSEHGALFSGMMVVLLCGFLLFSMVEFPFMCPKLMAVFLMMLGISECGNTLYSEKA